MQNNQTPEIPVDGLIREMSAKIGELMTENIALKIQVAELVSNLSHHENNGLRAEHLAQAYDQLAG